MNVTTIIDERTRLPLSIVAVIIATIVSVFVWNFTWISSVSARTDLAQAKAMETESRQDRQAEAIKEQRATINEIDKRTARIEAGMDILLKRDR